MPSSPPSCFHWWHAPIYVVAAIILLIAAASSPHLVKKSNPSAQELSTAPTSWDHLILALGFKNAYSSFAHALHLALALGGASLNLNNATVFAPRGELLLESDVARAVRRHVASGRYMFEDLILMEIGEEVRSLERGGDWSLRITDWENGGDNILKVNGVEIVEFEVYVDDWVVVHGIRKPFDDFFQF